MTATSAGEDSFLMALVDGYAKLESQKLDKILVVYTDEVVPDKYNQFVADVEKTISVALILQRKKNENGLTLNFESQNNDNTPIVFQPLEFLSFFHNEDTHVDINSTRYQWKLSKL